MELSESLLQLPAGGQVLLSDLTFQRIGGRLHEVKLPSLEVPKPRDTLDGQLKGKVDRRPDSGDGKPLQKLEGQRPGHSSAASSRRSSMDTTSTSPGVRCCCTMASRPSHREPTGKNGWLAQKAAHA